MRNPARRRRLLLSARTYSCFCSRLSAKIASPPFKSIYLLIERGIERGVQFSLGARTAWWLNSLIVSASHRRLIICKACKIFSLGCRRRTKNPMAARWDAAALRPSSHIYVFCCTCCFDLFILKYLSSPPPRHQHALHSRVGRRSALVFHIAWQRAAYKNHLVT